MQYEGWRLVEERFDDRADPATKQLVIDDQEATLVRAFFERCAAGASGASIARWANGQVHPSASKPKARPVGGELRAPPFL